MFIFYIFGHFVVLFLSMMVAGFNFFTYLKIKMLWIFVQKPITLLYTSTVWKIVKDQIRDFKFDFTSDLVKTIQ